MTGRDSILGQLRKNRPEPAPRPPAQSFEGRMETDLQKRFVHEAETAGSRVLFIRSRNELTSLFPGSHSAVWCNIPEIDFPNNLARSGLRPSGLEKLELTLVEGEIGVAENAAVWVPDVNAGLRISPFITRNLVILLPKERLVENLHIAYQQLHGRKYGFGTFISGPSKTADIEQLLVLGAHGPVSLTVCLTEE